MWYQSNITCISEINNNYYTTKMRICFVSPKSIKDGLSILARKDQVPTLLPGLNYKKISIIQ